MVDKENLEPHIHTGGCECITKYVLNIYKVGSNVIQGVTIKSPIFYRFLTKRQDKNYRDVFTSIKGMQLVFQDILQKESSHFDLLQ